MVGRRGRPEMIRQLGLGEEMVIAGRPPVVDLLQVGVEPHWFERLSTTVIVSMRLRSAADAAPEALSGW